MKKADEPAFPVNIVHGDGSMTYHAGLTKREWYAGMAMQGYLASGYKQAFDQAGATAEWAFDQADAMLAQEADDDGA